MISTIIVISHAFTKKKKRERKHVLHFFDFYIKKNFKNVKIINETALRFVLNSIHLD